jgi:hypothetical protein
VERYASARVISMMDAHPLLKAILAPYWRLATEQLLNKLVNSLSETYLSRADLRLSLDRYTNGSTVVSIQTRNASNWQGGANGLASVYPLDQISCGYAAITAEMMALMPAAAPSPVSIVQPQFSAPLPAPPVAPYGGVAQGQVIAVSPGPVGTMTSAPGMFPSPVLSSPVMQQMARGPMEVLSVTVPYNYPACGNVITVTSPMTGRPLNCNIPPGSLPGGQFMVQFQW